MNETSGCAAAVPSRATLIPAGCPLQADGLNGGEGEGVEEE